MATTFDFTPFSPRFFKAAPFFTAWLFLCGYYLHNNYMLYFTQSRISCMYVQYNGLRTDPTLYIIDDPTDTSAAAPFSGVFTCSAGGDGSTLVAEWKRSGSSLPSKSSYSTNVLSSGITTSSLVIPNVTNGDVGSYYCLVWRERRAVQSKSAHLAYAGKIFISIQCFIRYLCKIMLGSPVQPWIVLPDPLVNLTINNYNLTMKCMPDSNKLQYYWERQSNDLPSKAHGVNLSLLTITDLRPEDSGDYRCTVSNSTGRITSEYVKLVVQGTTNSKDLMSHCFTILMAYTLL